METDQQAGGAEEPTWSTTLPDDDGALDGATFFTQAGGGEVAAPQHRGSYQQGGGGGALVLAAGLAKVSKIEEESLDWVGRSVAEEGTPALPPRLNHDVLVCNVADTLKFKSLKSRTGWRKLFSRAPSKAFMTSAYWWIYLDIFACKDSAEGRPASRSSIGQSHQGNNKPMARGPVRPLPAADLARAKDALFGHLARAFFDLFFQMRSKTKDAFFAMYPDAVAQFVFLAMSSAYPNSKIYLDEAFKISVFNTVSYWVHGATAPKTANLAHWAGESTKKGRGSLRRIMFSLDTGPSGNTAGPKGGPTHHGSPKPRNGASRLKQGLDTAGKHNRAARSPRNAPHSPASPRSPSSPACPASPASPMSAASGNTNGGVVGRSALPALDGRGGARMRKNRTNARNQDHLDDEDRGQGNLVNVRATTVHSTLEISHSPLIDHVLRRNLQASQTAEKHVFRMTQSNRVYRPLPPDFLYAEAESRSAPTHRNGKSGASPPHQRAVLGAGPQTRNRNGASRSNRPAIGDGPDGGGTKSGPTSSSHETQLVLAKGRAGEGEGRLVPFGRGADADEYDDHDGVEVSEDDLLDRFSKETYQDVVCQTEERRQDLMQTFLEQRAELTRELKHFQRVTRRQVQELETSKRTAMRSGVHELSNYLVSLWKVEDE